MNKKGIAVDDFIPLLVTMFIFVIVILIVIIAVKVKDATTENKIVNFENRGETIRAVNDFLNREVVYENQKVKMIDLMATVRTDESQKIDFLRTQAEEQFKNHYSWIFEVKVAGKTVLNTAVASGAKGTVRCASQSSQEFEYLVETPQTEISFWCQ